MHAPPTCWQQSCNPSWQFLGADIAGQLLCPFVVVHEYWHCDTQLLSFQESKKWYCHVPWGWQIVVWKLEQLDMPWGVVHKYIRHPQGTIYPVALYFTVCVDLPPAGWQRERKQSAESSYSVRTAPLWLLSMLIPGYPKVIIWKKVQVTRPSNTYNSVTDRS